MVAKDDQKQKPKRKFKHLQTKGKPRIVRRRTEQGSSPDSMSSNPDVAYRGLLSDEDVTKGLESKSPNAQMTPLGHISGTRKNTPFISASRSLKPAAYFATSRKKDPNVKKGIIAKINLKSLREKGEYVRDLTNEETFNELGINQNKMAGDSALKAQEVLIKGNVSSKDILGFYHVAKIDEKKYKKIKKKGNEDKFAKKFFYHHTQEATPTSYSFKYTASSTPPNPKVLLPQYATRVTTPWIGGYSIETPASVGFYPTKRNLYRSGILKSPKR